MNTITKFLFILLIVIAGSVAAIGQARVGRTTGMTQEDALRVAVECVNKAAGFKAISDTHKIVLNRLEDKLEFLGITDNARLNALRRYLVRNEEVGTQSISFIDGGDADPNRRFYSYMITSHDLLGIKRDWTLLKLTQFIAKTAGYAKIPISTSRQIVADCESYHNNIYPDKPKKEIELRNDLAPDAKPSIPLADAVKLRPGLDRTKFAQCVMRNRQFGVRSARFDSTKGDTVRYFIELTIEKPDDFDDVTNDLNTDFLIYMINKDWTFGCVAEFISRTAQAELPKHSLAGQIAMKAIKNNLGKQGLDCAKDDPKDPDVTKECSFDKDSTLGSILRKDPNGNLVGLNKLIADIKANFNDRPASTYCDQNKGREVHVTTKRRGGSEKGRSTAQAPSPILDTDITASMTVEGLVNYVESKLSEIGGES